MRSSLNATGTQLIEQPQCDWYYLSSNYTPGRLFRLRFYSELAACKALARAAALQPAHSTTQARCSMAAVLLLPSTCRDRCSD